MSTDRSQQTPYRRSRQSIGGGQQSPRHQDAPPTVRSSQSSEKKKTQTWFAEHIPPPILHDDSFAVVDKLFQQPYVQTNRFRRPYVPTNPFIKNALYDAVRFIQAAHDYATGDHRDDLVLSYRFHLHSFLSNLLRCAASDGTVLFYDNHQRDVFCQIIGHLYRTIQKIGIDNIRYEMRPLTLRQSAQLQDRVNAMVDRFQSLHCHRDLKPLLDRILRIPIVRSG